MAWKPDYVTVADLKTHLRIPTADTADDATLALVATTASRAIEQETNRQFGQVDTATARVYTWEGDLIDMRPALEVDDLVDVTGLAVAIDQNYDGTYEVSLTDAVDYDLWPFNAAADGLAYTHLVLRPTSRSWFPRFARAVQVTGLFGWAAVPTAIVEATLLQAARLFTRRVAPFGIAGSPEVGSELRLLAKVDPDVAVAVAPYRRHWGAV